MSSRKTSRLRQQPPSGENLLDLPGDGMLTSPASSSVDAALRRGIEDDDADRLELARRLHKDVAGNLVASTAVIEMIRHQLAHENGAPEDIARMLGHIDGALRQTLQLVRQMTEEQFPPVLTAFGIGPALQQFVKQVEGGFAGRLILQVPDGEVELEPARRLNLFRTLQLMIRRCICDARASRVELTCATTPGTVEIHLDHDGDAGLWASTADDGDLAVIQARCGLLQAATHTTSLPDGTRITLLVPQQTAPIPS